MKHIHTVQTALLQPQPAPRVRRGIIGQVRANLFSNPFDSFITLVFGALAIWTLIPFINWAFVDAIWSGANRSVCTTNSQGGIQPDGWSGACWAFLRANFSQVIFHMYPDHERWRVGVAVLIAILVNAPLLTPSVPHKFINAAVSIFIVPLVGFFLLYGGVAGLPVVSTDQWGGLMVTLVIAYMSIALSLPIGTLLALGRVSKLAVFKTLSVIFIETIRGIPLVAILIIASFMLPAFLPKGMTIDNFLRVLIGVALFTSAYIAEVVRGGLQAVPKSQYEAAQSLGFGYFGTTFLVVLPQAFRIATPGIMNVLIGMFKETSLVYVVNMYDLLNKVQDISQQAKWLTPQTPNTGYVFAGLVFWLFCFAMSRYGLFIERRLNGAENDRNR